MDRYSAHQHTLMITFKSKCLIVGEPKFSSDIDLDGVIVDFCKNWEPDTVHMSCRVKYHGNIRPTLSWSNNADGSLVISSTYRKYDSSHGSTLKSNLTVIAQSNSEWHTFLCKANISKDMSSPIGRLNSKVPTLCRYTCVCSSLEFPCSYHVAVAKQGVYWAFVQSVLGSIQIGCVAIFSLRIIACDLRMRRQK